MTEDGAPDSTVPMPPSPGSKRAAEELPDFYVACAGLGTEVGSGALRGWSPQAPPRLVAALVRAAGQPSLLPPPTASRAA